MSNANSINDETGTTKRRRKIVRTADLIHMSLKKAAGLVLSMTREGMSVDKAVSLVARTYLLDVEDLGNMVTQLSSKE